MNQDSGFGANGAPFEYAVAEAKSKALTMRKLALIAAYVLWAVGLLVAGSVIKLILPVLCFIPLTVWMFAFLTWRYTQVEYEYSFFSGRLTVSRILGSRTRKQLTSVSLRELAAVFPCAETNLSRVESFGAETTIFAASSSEAPNLYVALWQDKESGKRTVLYFEANEKAIKIMKYYNMAAFAK